MSKKIRRKVKPSVPRWHWYNEPCFMCKNENGCGGCRYAKRANAYNRQGGPRYRNRPPAIEE